MKVKSAASVFLQYSILFVVCILFSASKGFAQAYPYEESWKKIEKEEQEGLLKSTLPLVTEIYHQAREDKEVVQKIRALLYQSKIAMITEDEVGQEAQLYQRFKSEISQAGPIEKNILESLLAGFLYEYFQYNGHRMWNRTPVLPGSANFDFLSWPAETLQEEISTLYESSLNQPQQLIDEPLGDWVLILDSVAEHRELRPTMYDLLVHRAVEYYRGNNEIEKAERLVRTLMDRHEGNSSRNAYLYNRLVLFNMKKQADAEQLTELKTLAKLHPDAWYTSEILLKLAEAYRGQSYAAKTGEEKKLYLDSALALGHLVKERYPQTTAHIRLQEIIIEPIVSPSFNFQSVKFTVPGKSIPIWVSHKNINTLYVRVLAFKRTFSTEGFSDIGIPKNVKTAADMDSLMNVYPMVQEYSRDLKIFDDYQSHSTLLNFEALKSGEYLILISNDSTFIPDTANVLAFQRIGVSQYAMAIRENEVLVTDRESGEMVKRLEVLQFRPLAGSGNLSLVQSAITDENGTVRMKEGVNFAEEDDFRAVFYQVKGDSVSFQTPHRYPVARNRSEASEEKVQIFTDRAIYRPGQVVYFKAILYQEKDQHRKVLENRRTTVRLYDTNNGEVASLELSSNTYGSVFGSFVLPTGTLTGNFYITADPDRSRKNIRVEEYKRPTFEVLMDTLKGTYKLDQKIVAKGSAQAFSGAAIDQAEVEYRVLRRARYPYLVWGGNARQGNSDSKEVTSGTTTTDAEGRFELSFVAEADAEQKEGFRFYQYDVSVTVTDRQGETQQGQQRLSVGDKSILLDFPTGASVNMGQMDSIPIQTRNLNGQPVAARGHIQLTKLKAPERVLTRAWYRPVDYLLEDSLTFIKRYPHLPYQNEMDVQNWAKGRRVLDEGFSSTGEHAVPMNSDRWEEGAYLLEAYVIDGQDTLRTSRLLSLYRTESKRPVDHEFLRVSLLKTSYEPGEKAEILISSAVKNAVVLVEFEQEGKIIKREQVLLNNNVRKIGYTVPDSAAGQVIVHYYMAKYNVVERGSLAIPVFQPAGDLNISTSTFRDKLQPGQEETWALKISGAGKDKVVPEVLALMYDASLDQFTKHALSFPGRNLFMPGGLGVWNMFPAYGVSYANGQPIQRKREGRQSVLHVDFNAFGFSLANPSGKQQQYLLKPRWREEANLVFMSAVSMDEVVVVGYGSPQAKQLMQGIVSGVNVTLRGDGTVPADMPPPEDIEMLKAVPVRNDLKETAFFFPDLKTDEEGNLILKFTTPERLTEWRFMAFAHTRDLQTGYLEKSVRTSKDLMVVPNAPRFLRAGDELSLSSKIINLSGSLLSGSTRLLFFDALSMQPLDSLFAVSSAVQKFDVPEKGSTVVSWRVTIPEGQGPVVYRIVAAAGNFSDGEEAVLPILPNKQLVTESLSLQAGEGEKKSFVLSGLANSKDADHVGLTLEITTNPIWYALQALPYLNDSAYPSSEQVFAKLYSAMISKHLLDSSPELKHLIAQSGQGEELQSPLERNEELKVLLAQETPWLRAAEDEEAQMKRLALLLDLNHLRQQLGATLQKLTAMQLSTGAFPWFDGGPANDMISLHLLAGFGHLKDLGIQELALPGSETLEATYQRIILKTIDYLDDQVKESDDHIIFYLYARSYFLEERALDKTTVTALLKKIEANRSGHSLQSKAMLAMVYQRFGDSQKAVALVRSLKDYAVQSAEMGMYWKDNVSGWKWWQSPVENQALLIEAFQEVTQDQESVKQMKLWLLKNKQTNRWATSKATTEAIYALLRDVPPSFVANEGVEVSIGGEAIDLKGASAATGYRKTTWHASEIKPAMAQVEINKSSPGLVYGALYWQYFEDLSKIQSSSNGVDLQKSLFLKKTSDKGPVLIPITPESPIKVGDVVTVRLLIRADRDLQFMHLKDMRASGFEPMNVLSTYKWQDNLGYYESTRDAATHFFFDRMPKGTYVFEYDLRANNAGTFSNGITVLQSMYAPEMSAHSSGDTIHIF